MEKYKSKQSGQVVIVAVIFFMLIVTTISMAVINPVIRQMRQADDFTKTRASFFVSQSVNEDALYRLKMNKKFVSPSTLSLNGYSATATSSNAVGGLQIDSSGSASGLIRNIRTHLSSGSGASFNYGVQVGDGGVIFEHSSSVVGNLYSNGPVTGTGNIVKGDVVSAGPSGLISGMHATSSAYAHTISGSTIDKDAYYQTITGSTVTGTSYPGSADQATSTLPISDTMIANMESDAVAGGTYSDECPYKVANNATIGPLKVNCDLEIDGNTVTLAGTVWVSGNIAIKNSSTVKVSSSLGNKSVAMIADKISDRAGSGRISLKNNTTFQGSGSASSFVVLISQNNSAEQGGSVKAIETENSVNGKVLVYAGHGEISLANNINVKEVTAYRIRLQNSAQVTYDTGLANLLFTSGPSGGYVFDGWREVQ